MKVTIIVRSGGTMVSSQVDWPSTTGVAEYGEWAKLPASKFAEVMDMTRQHPEMSPLIFAFLVDAMSEVKENFYAILQRIKMKREDAQEIVHEYLKNRKAAVSVKENFYAILQRIADGEDAQEIVRAYLKNRNLSPFDNHIENLDW